MIRHYISANLHCCTCSQGRRLIIARPDSAADLALGVALISTTCRQGICCLQGGGRNPILTAGGVAARGCVFQLLAGGISAPATLQSLHDRLHSFIELFQGIHINRCGRGSVSFFVGCDVNIANPVVQRLVLPLADPAVVGVGAIRAKNKSVKAVQLPSCGRAATCNGKTLLCCGCTGKA